MEFVLPPKMVAQPWEIIISGISRAGKDRKCFIWFLVMDYYNIGVPL
jgi:hypothetical protein